MKGKKLYIVSAHGRSQAGKHGWFGCAFLGGYRDWSNHIATRSLRHANAVYRRLKPSERQMDLRHNGRATVLKYGASA